MDVHGHRGCRGLYPENSLPAFEKALDLNVTTLELDVVISKDGKVVVSHEPFMNHEITLDPSGNTIAKKDEMLFNLYAMPYNTIRRYDCGSKTHQRFPFQKNLKVYKPLLVEVIDLAEKQSNQTIVYNIEIKSKPEYDTIYTPKVDDFVELVLEILERKRISNRVILQSFDLRALEVIKKKGIGVKIAVLIDENEYIDMQLKKLSFEPTIISPHFKLLTQEMVLKYQKKGFDIIPWTVNTVKDITTIMSFGVDGIISDFPDKVLLIKQIKKIIL